MLDRAPSLKLLAFTLLALACAKSPPSGGAGTYRGVAANLKEIGVFEVTVQEADKGPLPATGTLKFPSKTVELTGTLDKSKTQLTMTSGSDYSVVGTSRPGYVRGAYQNAKGDDVGSFGIILQGEGTSVELFCGSMLDTTDTETKGLTMPLAIAAVPGGYAVCVGQTFSYLGGFASDEKVLGCTQANEAQINGDVTATSGNKWGTGTVYGSWTVSPCADNGAGGSDAGVPDGAVAADASN
jgi:hypothetical protein